jgi:GrpB-like predicted nucleotidyltransferase (UPF0157 family)
MSTRIIKPATKPRADYHEWDPVYPLVVDSFLHAIKNKVVKYEISHIGSTSIEGCGGKGVIDLLCEYDIGCLNEAIEVLLEIGFNHQGSDFANPWPMHRPMLLGNYVFNGMDYLIYVHVVERNKDEGRRFRDFQRVLKGNVEKVKLYNQCKREIIASGVTDTDEYAKKKSEIMRDLLGELHHVKYEK